MDLFRDVVPRDKQHSNYRKISSGGAFASAREVLESWAVGFVDRDQKFVAEFQTTFNSCFWELYLHAAFVRLGITVDFSRSAPDFLLDFRGETFVAEATTTSHPLGYTAEWERDVSLESLSCIDSEEIVHMATVRLANSLDSKHKKYLNSYRKLDHVSGRPFVICLAPFEQPFFFLQADNALRRVLYGYDQPLYVDDPDTGERTILGEARLASFCKPSGAEVPLGLFCSDRMKEVSAVIFSSVATFGKVRALSKPGETPIVFDALRYNSQGPQAFHVVAEKPKYTETLLDGLHLCLNPFADWPLDPGPFAGREIQIHRFDPESGTYFPDAPHGFLMRRSCVSLQPESVAAATSECAAVSKLMIPYPREEWREGQLYQVHGTVGTFTEHWMGHYRG